MKQDQSKNQNLPREIEEHLLKLMKSLELPDNEENFSRLHDAWIRKEGLFESQTGALEMETAEELPEGDGRGAILLTSSGSLLSLSPERKEGRWMEYASIPIRTDVPDILKGEKVTLASPPCLGKPLVLTDAPLKQTSPLYRIAVCREGTSAVEQEKRIREATIFLTNGFVRINKNMTAVETGGIEHFTKQSLIAYVAKRNDLTRKQVLGVIDDFFTMAESGILLGEKVPLGSLGRMGYKVRPPRQARVITNPATGEEMTVPAKPSRAAVKFFPSGRLKKLASAIPVEEEEAE
jgi:nucleoid DNA-binding protein